MTMIADLPASPLVVKAFERLANYVYDGNVGQYRDASTGRFVSYKSVYSLLDLNERANEEIMQGVTMAFQDGAVDAPHWYLAMANQQRMLTVQQAALGAGGFDNLKPADFRRIEAQLRDDFQRLHRFGRQIEAGQVSPGQAQVRVGMYAGRARTQFFKSQPMPVVKKGEMAIERRRLTPAEHCAWCLYLADLGWQPYGTLPVPCESSAVWQNGQCLTNCKCDLERRIVPLAEAKRLLSTKTFDPSAVKSAPATSAFAMAPDRFSDAECLQMVINAAQTEHYEIACLTVNGYGSEQYTTTGGEGAAVNVEKLLKILAELHQRGAVETAHLYHTHPVPADETDYEPFGIMHDLSIFSAAAGIGLRVMTIIDAQGRSQAFVQGSPALSGQMVIDRYNALYSQLVARFEDKQKRSPSGDEVDRLLLIVNKKICQEAGIRYRVTPIAGWSVKGGPGSGYHGHAGRPGEVGGSAPAGMTLQSAEDSIRNKDKEYLYLFDRDGNMVFEAVGDAEKVGIPHDVETTGSVMTHNHPVNPDNYSYAPSLSLGDLKQAIDDQLQEVRAVGDRYTYSMRFSPATFGDKDFRNRVLTAYGNARAEIVDDLMLKVEAGEMKKRDVRTETQHLANVRLAKEFPEITYTRINAPVFVKGGPGSGYHGHAGRPGKVGGSAPDGVQDREKLDEALAQVESEIRIQTYETLVVLDKNGNKLDSSDGASNHVVVSDKTLSFMKGNIITHNHPSGWEFDPSEPQHAGNSFGIEDLRVAFEGEVAEIRAVTPMHVYTMRPPPGGWNGDIWRDKAERVYHLMNETVRSDFMNGINDGSLTISEANARHYHEVCTRFAKAIGADYSRRLFYPAPEQGDA